MYCIYDLILSVDLFIVIVFNYCLLCLLFMRVFAGFGCLLVCLCLIWSAWCDD